MNELRIGGALVFWKLSGQADHERLRDSLHECQLREFCPDPRVPLAIMKEALGKTYPGSTTMVRTLASKTGFAVVSEKKGDDWNDYDHQGAVKLIDQDWSFSGVSEDDRKLILGAYHEAAGYVSSGQVAMALTKIISYMRGVPLRPSGAVYWVPDDQLGEFEDVAAAIENSAVVPDSYMIHRMQHVLDDSAVRAISEGLVDEVSGRVQELEKELKGGELQKRALKNRWSEIEATRKKVQHFEESLSRALPQLTEKLDKLQHLSAFAGLLNRAEAEDASH